MELNTQLNLLRHLPPLMPPGMNGLMPGGQFPGGRMPPPRHGGKPGVDGMGPPPMGAPNGKRPPPPPPPPPPPRGEMSENVRRLAIAATSDYGTLPWQET